MFSDGWLGQALAGSDFSPAMMIGAVVGSSFGVTLISVIAAVAIQGWLEQRKVDKVLRRLDESFSETSSINSYETVRSKFSHNVSW